LMGSEAAPGRQAVKNFFTLLFSGKLSKAEEALDRIRRRYKLSENDGYYKALYGIYYSYISDDRDSYIFELWRRYLAGEKKEDLKAAFKELLEGSLEPPRGFIQAWLDLIDIIDSLPTPHKLEKQSKQAGEG